MASITSNKSTCEPVPKNSGTANKIAREARDLKEQKSLIACATTFVLVFDGLVFMSSKTY
jgi:hypothetical protein